MFAFNSRRIDGLLSKYSLLTTQKYMYYDLKRDRGKFVAEGSTSSRSKRKRVPGQGADR